MTRLKSGCELIFMAPASRRHEGQPVMDAVMAQAKALGITRMTIRADQEGAGASGRLHSAHFFELNDQPFEVVYVVDEETADRLLERVEAEGIDVFCLCVPVRFGNPARPEE